MALEWLLIAELLLLGSGTGFLAGFLGIGGATLLVPFTTLILIRHGVAPAPAVKAAIATSMAVIVFTSVSSAWSHHRRGAVRWPLVATLSPGIALGALLASTAVFPKLQGAVLSCAFALFVAVSATQMLRNAAPTPARQLPGPAGQVAAGGLIGFLSGLVGAGGAFVSIPFMTWCNVPMHHAVATSAALGFPIALVNTLGYVAGGWDRPGTLPASLGYVWLPGVLVPVCTSVLTAPLGARLAHTMDTQTLKRAFAWVLYALAGYMLWQGIR